MSNDINALGNNKLNSNSDVRIIKLESKVDLLLRLLEEEKATQRAIANIKIDLPVIIGEAIKAVLNKRAVMAYSKLSS